MDNQTYNGMVDARYQNYSETIQQIEELRQVLKKLEKNIISQLPQGISSKFISTEYDFLNWVEEADFTLAEYESRK